MWVSILIYKRYYVVEKQVLNVGIKDVCWPKCVAILLWWMWVWWEPIEMPRKLTVSMFRVTVMMFRLMVESVILEMELARDMFTGWWNKIETLSYYFFCLNKILRKKLNTSKCWQVTIVYLIDSWVYNEIFSYFFLNWNNNEVAKVLFFMIIILVHKLFTSLFGHNVKSNLFILWVWVWYINITRKTLKDILKFQKHFFSWSDQWS